MPDELVARGPRAERKEAQEDPVRAYLVSRLDRAKDLKIDPVPGEPLKYVVKSGTREGLYWTVDLYEDPPCQCEDQWFNGYRIKGFCKHVIAAWLQERDEGWVMALGERLLRAELRKAEAAARQRASGDEEEDPHGEKHG